LRRLKEIRSIDRKIEAKRTMLPEYKAWVEGVVAADAGVGSGTAADVVPTCMVWLIDVGAYGEALDLVPFLLRHRVEMPRRYERDVATIVVEEIADAAARAQNAGQRFDQAVLDTAEALTIRPRHPRSGPRQAAQGHRHRAAAHRRGHAGRGQRHRPAQRARPSARGPAPA
jgi:hypothetical protein